MNVVRGAAIPVAVAISLGSTRPLAPQFDPAKAAWRLRATSHFEIYYPRTLDVGSIPQEAERAYAEMSRERHQQVSGKVPLMLLPTTADLPRTEQEAAVIVRASGAPARDHLMLAVEPRNGRESRLANGLTHIFEFEGRPAQQPRVVPDLLPAPSVISCSVPPGTAAAYARPAAAIASPRQS